MVLEHILNTPLLEDSRSPRSAPAAKPASRGRTLLETHFDLVQKRLQHLSRRSGLPEHEAEEFRSWALLKLVEEDYRILARWEGRSSFLTYLTVVLVNLMRDYRIHVWGKWRPSAAARREGNEAVLLERLLFRDGLSLDEAIQRMRTEHGVSLPPAELERIAAALPQRTGRRRADEEELLRIPVDGRVEAGVEGKERARTAARLREVLPPLLRELPAEERRVLELHYRGGSSMAAIALLVGRPQRELYASRDRCLRKLRRSLENAGLTAEQVGALLGEPL
ncbi:MAG TPA: sigma-70 family RNA polymerase sigma factor [Thermoanaerobaculia bacterium]|jgi:RNA polymerase sigma factor (sigma-70 family)|nr:sigma-70 family RNA polymerase sigma factor [Thermoanaerobaculia bacterium]